MDIPKKLERSNRVQFENDSENRLTDHANGRSPRVVNGKLDATWMTATVVLSVGIVGKPMA